MKLLALILTTLIIAINSLAIAQNMVHNPSFEEKTSCPDDAGQLNKCLEWSNTTSYASNYFNSCDPGDMNVPFNNYHGNLFAYSGEAYVGSFYLVKLGGAEEYFHRSYITGNLTPLQIGNCYEVIIHLAKGDAPSVNISVDGWGAFFYKNGLPSENQGILNATPQIDFYNYGVITNTSWTELTSTFIADSAYEKIVIGVFKAPGDMTIISTDDNGYAFYFIDSVSVRPLFPATISNSNNPKIQVYPNPAKDKIQIKGISGSVHYTLYDVVGRLIQTGCTSEDNLVTIERLPDGIYTLNLEDSNGTVNTYRIVKE